MPRRNLWSQSVPRVALDQRSRKARRWLEQIERLLISRAAVTHSRRQRLVCLCRIEKYGGARSKMYIVGLLALVCAGCNAGASRVVPEPDRITLMDALVSTVDALNAAYEEARKPGNQVIGYYPCTVTAVYNISANGVTNNKIGGGITGGPPGVAISANASAENDLTAMRGNQVTLVFASSLCAPGHGAEAGKAVPAANEKPSAVSKASSGGKVAHANAPPQLGPMPAPVFSPSVRIEQLPQMQ